MRILFTSAHSLSYYGGCEKWTIYVANELVKRGHSVQVMNLSYEPGNIKRVSLDSISAQFKFSYDEVPCRKGRITPLQFSELKPINDFDVVYTTAAYYNVLSQILEATKDIRRVFGMHDPSFQLSRLNRRQQNIIEKLLPRFDLIHLQDESQRKLLGDENLNIKVLQTWFNRDIPEIPEKSGEFTVVFLGRHETDKGFDDLVFVAKHLPENVRLIVLGTGSRSTELEAPDIKNRSNVEVKGFVSDSELDEILTRAHAALYPSRAESTTSMSLNDAMTHALPLIYRKIPQNEILFSSQMCRPIDSSEDAIKEISQLANEYYSDPGTFNKNCHSLVELVNARGDYVGEFLEQILKP